MATIFDDLDTYIPVSDAMLRAKEFNVIDALVFGKIWRMSSQKGYCYASKNTLSKDLGISYNTASRTIKKLLNSNLIEDVTPSYFVSKRQVRHYAPNIEKFEELIHQNCLSKIDEVKNDVSIIDEDIVKTDEVLHQNCLSASSNLMIDSSNLGDKERIKKEINKEVKKELKDKQKISSDSNKKNVDDSFSNFKEFNITSSTKEQLIKFCERSEFEILKEKYLSNKLEFDKKLESLTYLEGQESKRRMGCVVRDFCDEKPDWFRSYFSRE